jgi:glycine/D-amino acid oxidase-like deaminating enzyme
MATTGGGPDDGDPDPGLPADDTPYWLRRERPFAGFRSTPRLDGRVDVLVVGAGLLGASAAYHLAPLVAERGWRVAVVERGDPAGEASGRNGGHFETIPENSVGTYEGLAHERLKFLRRRHPGVEPEVLAIEAERQASLVLGFALRNRSLLLRIVREQAIACDLAARGWLFVADREDHEQGLCDEVLLAARHGEAVELWSRRRILDEFGFASAFLGRFVPGDGTYDPVKYVGGLLRAALAGGVELHTGVGVVALEPLAGGHGHRVATTEGAVEAAHVVVATNAFTRQLLPELAAIEPRQSQVMLTEDAPDRARGRLVTSEDGPVYWSQPRAGARRGRAPLLMGGGADRRMANPASRRRSTLVHAQLLALRDQYFPELHGRPPASEWIGPMSFTPDQLPAVGELRPGLVVAVACNGYGGSYTTAAGEAAAMVVATGEPPDWLPADVFSPRRLVDRASPYDDQQTLWRVAVALARQLVESTSDWVGERSQSARPSRRAAGRPVRQVAVPGDGAPGRPEDLAGLATFAAFDDVERADLAGRMQRRTYGAGDVLFQEGDPGGSCYVVIAGSVDVVVDAGGRGELAARLDVGATFGELTILGLENRTATCVAAVATSVLELTRPACEALLAERTPVARKFVAVLTRNLVARLRHADRRRLRATREGRPS